MKAQDNKARDHRVKHGRPPQRAKHWHDKAVAFARQHGLVVGGVLDMHDHLADLKEWIDGMGRAEAEWSAWNDVVSILSSRRVA